MPAVETLEMSSGRGPDVGSSPCSRQGEDLVHGVDTLEIVEGSWFLKVLYT